ncbi:hypothetical protein ACFSLT_21215 [Novosphingobium resinovorum]
MERDAWLGRGFSGVSEPMPRIEIIRSPPPLLATTRPGTLPLSPVTSVMFALFSVSSVTAVTDSDAFWSVTLVRSAETTISPIGPPPPSAAAAAVSAAASAASARAEAGQVAASNARTETPVAPMNRAVVVTITPICEGAPHGYARWHRLSAAEDPHSRRAIDRCSGSPLHSSLALFPEPFV